MTTLSLMNPSLERPTRPAVRIASAPGAGEAAEAGQAGPTRDGAARQVLVVDDERDLLDLLSFNLKRAGYQVRTAATGREAMAAIAARVPDLIVLDVMLPEMPGTAVASQVRSNPETAHVPIIMLTAKSQEADEVVGLAAGADDYVTKPFSVKVLAARIAALLRRASRPTGGQKELRLGALTLNTDTHEASVDGEPVRFTLTEFRILSALVQAEGRVLSRAALMSKAMGPGVTVTERTIDVHVTSIRKRLGDHAGLIRTVRGVGYRATPSPEGGPGGG